MSIPAEFSLLWMTHPQWFNVRKMLDVPDWITETCCVQISHAMGAAGLPVIPNAGRGWTSKTGRRHFLAVHELRSELMVLFGPPEVDSRQVGIEKNLAKMKQSISGKQGIIVFGERHIDLWNGTKIHGEQYIHDALWKAPSTLTKGILLWETE